MLVYGYDVVRRLRAAGLDVGDASVYGTLRRLYAGGHLTSYVVPSEEGPHRRYYAINDAYPKAQRQFDPDSGQSTPVPAPEFRPPPGPLRSP